VKEVNEMDEVLPLTLALSPGGGEGRHRREKGKS